MRTGKKLRYLVSNPRAHGSSLDRFPLTLAWQGVDDDESDWTFKLIGVVQTYPDPNPAPETRDHYKVSPIKLKLKLSAELV